MNTPPTKTKGSNDFWVRNVIANATVLPKSLWLEFLRLREDFLIMKHGTVEATKSNHFFMKESNTRLTRR
jgi:hypothetical protein